MYGCKGTSGKNPITDQDVRKGFDGLNMEFAKNAPPEKIFEETVFPLAIKLNNRGASNIENGFLVIGLEKAYLDFANSDGNQKLIRIDGKSVFNLNGGEDYVTINGITKKIGVQSETHPSTILATACYGYQTVLGTSACIDTDIFDTGLRKKSCQAKSLDFREGQGAPLAITKIEPQMLPDQDSNKIKPHFIIFIENKGKGQVIRQTKVQDACTKSSLTISPLTIEDFNRITIRAFLSGNQLNCNVGNNPGDIEVRLREEKGMVRCTLEEGIDRTQDAFMAPLRIEMDYGYTFTISKDITIEKILRH